MNLRLSDIAFAEGLARVEAHLELATAINAAGNAKLALVQASRPMIELMPRLSRELWAFPEIATEVNQSVGAIASGIRTGSKQVHIHNLADKVRTAAARAVAAVVGEGHLDDAFVSSVVVALLRTAALANRGASHSSGSTIRYGRADAVAYVARARKMCAAHWQDEDGPEGLDGTFASLQEQLSVQTEADPEVFDATVESIAELLHNNAGALLEQEPGLADFLERISHLLSDAETAYGAGEAFRADKLVAVAYVENYALVSDELTSIDRTASQDIETALTELRLRMRDEAGVAEIARLADRGRSALALLRRVIGA